LDLVATAISLTRRYGRVEHLALAEGQFLVPFRRCRSRKTSAISKTEPVLISPCTRGSADSRSVPPRNLSTLENLEDLVDLVGADELTQTDGAGVLRRSYLHPVVENLQDVERRLLDEISRVSIPVICATP